MFLAGIEVRLGEVGGGDQLSGSVEVASLLGEEGIGVHAVHLDGDTRRPQINRLGHRHASVERQGTPGAGAGLGELLGEHDANEGRHAGRDRAPRRRPRPGRGCEIGLLGVGHAVLQRGEGAPVEEVGDVHGVTRPRLVSANAWTPAVSPWTWW